MATVVTWHCRNPAAMACRSAVQAPKWRTWGGKTARTLGAAEAATALGGTQTQKSVAPTSMPAACGLRVCSKAVVAGADGNAGDVRRGMASSRRGVTHRGQGPRD